MKRKRNASQDEFELDDLDMDLDFDDDDDDDDGLDEFDLEHDSINEFIGERKLKSRSDRLVADYTADLKGPEVLVVLIHGTTLASALRTARPDLNFTFWTPEHFFFRTLQKYHGDAGVAASTGAGKSTLVCAPDLPPGPFDEVLFSTFCGDPSEQAQDLLQMIHQRSALRWPIDRIDKQSQRQMGSEPAAVDLPERCREQTKTRRGLCRDEDVGTEKDPWLSRKVGVSAGRTTRLCRNASGGLQPSSH